MTSIVATISLRFGKSLQFYVWLTLYTAFTGVKIMMMKVYNELSPFRWNYLPLTDIDPLLHYNIGWQPEEKLLLHSKNVFDYLAIMITINSGNLVFRVCLTETVQYYTDNLFITASVTLDSLINL